MPWSKVEEALPEVQALIFDGCHKIYLALDAEQVGQFQELGYGDGTDDSRLVEVGEASDPVGVLREWFENSCGLRFIQSVRTVTSHPSAGFDQLISQSEIPRYEGEFDEEEDTDDE